MKILVLDTETLGLTDRRVYDLGYLIYDAETGEVLKSRDYIVKQVYDNQELMNSAYYKNKLPIYEERLADGYCKKCYWGIILRILEKDLQKYCPDGIYAYNSRFDYSSIKETCKQYNSKINPTADGIIDIMNYLDTICETEDYKEFCEINGYLTKHKTPRCRRTAEVVYRYLNNNNEYEEQHTALEDSKIELEILLKALGIA